MSAQRFNFLAMTADGVDHELIDITDNEEAVDILSNSFFCSPCVGCFAQGCGCCLGAGFHYVQSAT